MGPAAFRAFLASYDNTKYRKWINVTNVPGQSSTSYQPIQVKSLKPIETFSLQIVNK